MNPKISIIVPVYNAEEYIKKCINSILNQTFGEIEVILINDGSTDRSLEILREYESKDSRIRIINQNNSGPSVARNKGIKVASGDYIGFVDSDDYIEQEMYEVLYKTAIADRAQITMCNYKEVHIYNNTSLLSDHKLQEGKLYNRYEIEHDIISKFSKSENYGFYSLWNKLYHKEWLLSTDILMDESRDHAEDWWFNIQLFSQLESFICSSKTLYNYIHINQTSLMRKYRENQFDLCLDGRKKLIATIKDDLIDYRDLNTRFIFEYLGYILNTVKNVENKNKCYLLVENVLKNTEVQKSCRNHYKLSFKHNIFLYFVLRKNIKMVILLSRLANLI